MIVRTIRASVLGGSVFAAFAFAALPAAQAAETPQILLGSGNTVPACVTPNRLMSFMQKRNRKLNKKFNNIAGYYRKHGQDIGVRWDYAFFQMLVETNWLRFRTPSGRPGLVRVRQNNFAGLGATGGKNKGEHFKSVSDGVLAHLQHVKMYSGQLVKNPVAKRTAKVQKWLVGEIRNDGPDPKTFTDLTKRWSPNDNGYSNDIERIARSFRDSYCGDVNATSAIQEARSDKIRTDARMALGAGGALSKPGADVETPAASAKRKMKCQVWTASYGGKKSLLIKSVSAEKIVHYTALEVHDGMETAQADAFIKAWAQGGKPIGEYGSHTEALAQAYQLCPAT